MSFEIGIVQRKNCLVSMFVKIISCNRLLILSVLLQQVYTEEGKIICTVEEEKRNKNENVTKTFDLSNVTAKNSITRECYYAPKLTLEGASVLTLDGLDDVEDFVNYLFGVKELEMCVAIENTVVMNEIPVDTKRMKATCKGPLLRIVNNTNLFRFTLHPYLVENLESIPDAIRVRGNRILEDTYVRQLEQQRKSVNGNWDLQPVGECVLPTPFTSFEVLDRNCTNFYGRIVLEQGIKEFQYDSSKIHKFNTVGCIQIEKTELRDITFLKAFSKFQPMQSCTQFIRDNEKLCSKNLKYLNTIFKDIHFSNNGDQFCDECIGGEVSEYYLDESVNCSLILGDLIIANFRGLPLNFKNLRSIETIEGRLVIINNTGLYKFDYLSSLKIVGRSTAGGAAIIVKDNADLSLLALPNLLNIQLNKSDETVEVLNNPMLTEDIGRATVVHITTPKIYTTTKNYDGSTAVKEKNKQQGPITAEKSTHSEKALHTTTIFGGVAATLILMCSLASVFVCRRKTNISRLPQPPYELYIKSQEKLRLLCLVILERSPTIWYAEEFDLLWKQSPRTARDVVPPSLRHAEFIKSYMIPTANNGALPQRKDDTHYKRRAKELLHYDLIIMIGNTSNVGEIVPDLPSTCGDLSTYTDGKSNISIAYKLLEVKQFSSRLASYTYETKDTNRNVVKKIELLLYQWPTERLPTDFTELLQLIAVTKGRKVICASNRRKEVFSLLYLLHACVLTEELTQGLAEAFQLHSQLCNGAPLDRLEMLYLMRTLLHWGSRAGCIRKENREEFAQWCRTYGCMANFYRKHRNIMNIHPLHLGYLEGSAMMNIYMDTVRRKVVNFSERPCSPMRDHFRKVISEEIKEGPDLTMESASQSIVQGISPGTDTESSNISTSSTRLQATKGTTSIAAASEKKRVY